MEHSRSLRLTVVLVASLLMASSSAVAQQNAQQNSGAAVAPVSPASVAGSVVPHLVNYSGVLKDGSGKPITGVTGVTFMLYPDQQGGSPVWMETQNVTPDKAGHYSAQLGATRPEGLPLEVFMTGEARWLAVQVSGEVEQARVLLVAVPYALKAADAETVGGLPPSAFVLATPTVSGAGPRAATAAAANASVPSVSSDVTTTGGTVSTIPLFSTATNIQTSAITQTGSGTTAKIGIGIATPAATLDIKGGAYVRGQFTLPSTGIATATAGKNSEPNLMIASAYDSATSAAVNQKFQLQAEPAGNDTAAASGTLNLLYGSGTAAATETGLKIGSNGRITFATGQSFPGTGTITGITTASGSGLAGGGSSGILNLSVPAGGITNTMLVDPFLTISAGTDLTGGGLVALGGGTTLSLDTTKVPLLVAANTFVGNQTVTGGLTATGVVTGSGFQIAGSSLMFAFGSNANGNANLGFAGNLGPANTGTQNTAVGISALSANTTGRDNTASGVDALLSNTTGIFNTASGGLALGSNTTGSYNTATGTSAGETVDASSLTGNFNTAMGTNAAFGTGTLSNATAIGGDAEVTVSNAMVLGSILGVNGCSTSNSCNNTMVGIGTTAPVFSLDVHGTGHFTQAVTFASPVTFAATQTFPGAAELTTANTFTGTQTISSTTGNGVFATSSNSTSAGVYASNSSTSGTANGVFGTTSSSAGTGVVGTNSAATGNAYGMYGQSLSSTGTGVYGTGNSTGVTGVSSSTTGTGVFGNSTATSGNGNGVAGTSNSPSGSGVVANNFSGSGAGYGLYANSASSSGTGVYAQGNGAGVTGTSGSTSGTGVIGNSTATSGNANGMAGTSNSPSGSGVVANNLASSGSAYGLYAHSASPVGTAVFGTGGTTGVYGTVSAINGSGIYGINSGSSAGYGVFGESDGTASGSTGIYGTATGTSGSTYGVYGQSASSKGVGVQGVAISNSGTGTAFSGRVGVWGDTSSGTGVLGTADNNTAITAENNTGSTGQDTAALYAYNGTTDTGSIVAEFLSGSGGYCFMVTNGDWDCGGDLAVIASTTEGRQVRLSGVASTESWFEDFGSGDLSGGSAKVSLDSTFVSTVNTGESYHVFLTPNGDCKGLYVASKTPTGFEVREIGGGVSNISFDYRIVAKRRGYENVRMQDVTERVAKIRQRQQGTPAKDGGRARGPLPRPVAPEPIAPQLVAPKYVPQTEPAQTHFTSSEKTLPVASR
jgi:hypothetical protein